MTQQNNIRPDVVLFMVQPDRGYRKELERAGVLKTSPDQAKREKKKSSPGICTVDDERYISTGLAYRQLESLGFEITDVHLEEKPGGFLVCYIAMAGGAPVSDQVRQAAENLLTKPVMMGLSVYENYPDDDGTILHAVVVQSVPGDLQFSVSGGWGAKSRSW